MLYFLFLLLNDIFILFLLHVYIYTRNNEEYFHVGVVANIVIWFKIFANIVQCEGIYRHNKV